MSHGNGTAILCVDDDPEILGSLERLLASSGYTVKTAANGVAALAILQQPAHNIRAVITDLRMPGMSGTHLIHRARAIGFVRPFIIVSGSITPADRKYLNRLGVASVLEKPARPEELIETVRQASA